MNSSFLGKVLSVKLPKVTFNGFFPRCLKKYCECFKADKLCGKQCTCINCKNKGTRSQLNTTDQSQPQRSSPSKKSNDNQSLLADQSATDTSISQIEQHKKEQSTHLTGRSETNISQIERRKKKQPTHYSDMEVTDEELLYTITQNGWERDLRLSECEVQSIVNSIDFSHMISPDIIEREMWQMMALVEESKSSTRSRSAGKRKREWLQDDSASEIMSADNKRSKISTSVDGNHNLACLYDKHRDVLYPISETPCVVGADPNIVSIRLDEPGLQAAHATILCEDQQWLIHGMTYLICTCSEFLPGAHDK